MKENRSLCAYRQCRNSGSYGVLILKRVMIFGMNLILIDTDTMDQITERYINEASKGDMEGYVKSLIDTFQKTRRALPWYFYLKS